MDERTTAADVPSRPRRWTRVESGPAAETKRRPAAGKHEFAVYPARLVRCSCGAAFLATDPAALQLPIAALDDEVLSLHASWCDELEVADFAAAPVVNNGRGGEAPRA